MNLVETIKAHATPRLPESISTILGISPDRIRTCLGAAIPSILAVIAARASTPDDAHALARTLASADESILADVPIAVTTQGAALMNRGGDQLGSLIGGGALTALISTIARYTGKSPGSVRSITGFAAAIVLATLRRQQRTRGLDEAALSKLLSEQKPHIAAAMPPSLPGLLAASAGLGPIADYMRALIPTSAAAAPSPADQLPRRHSAATAPPVSRNRRHHQRRRGPGHRRPIPSWAWILPAAAVIVVGWIVIASLGPSSPPRTGAVTATAGASPRILAADSATPQQVQEEIADILNAAATTLSTVRDEPSAEAAVPVIRELIQRLDAARGAFDRLPGADRTPIVSTISDNLGGRLRNAAEHVQTSRATRERLGPHVDTFFRKLRGFTTQ